MCLRVFAPYVVRALQPLLRFARMAERAHVLAHVVRRYSPFFSRASDRPALLECRARFLIIVKLVRGQTGIMQGTPRGGHGWRPLCETSGCERHVDRKRNRCAHRIPPERPIGLN